MANIRSKLYCLSVFTNEIRRVKSEFFTRNVNTVAVNYVWVRFLCNSLSDSKHSLLPLGFHLQHPCSHFKCQCWEMDLIPMKAFHSAQKNHRADPPCVYNAGGRQRDVKLLHTKFNWSPIGYSSKKEKPIERFPKN